MYGYLFNFKLCIVFINNIFLKIKYHEFKKLITTMRFDSKIPTSKSLIFHFQK